MAYALKAAAPSLRTLRGLGTLIGGVCVTFHGTLRRTRRRSNDPDHYLDLPDVQHRPDPLLYAQHYLLARGLAVTWDNPDIQLYEVSDAAPDALGAPIDSAKLQPGHRYRVRVRVWNGSYDAPAVGIPVHLSYARFGAGALLHPIATDHVSLGVKGGAQAPAFATFDWTTPDDAGQYCLQALLSWPDDANPDNNLGHENVSVGTTSSTGEFRFVVRNPAGVRRRIVFEADTYEFPALPPATADLAPEQYPHRQAESKARWEAARAVHSRSGFPLPAGWRIDYDPPEPELAPGAEQEVTVRVRPAAESTIAPAAVNVNAFAVDQRSRTHVGGVTLRLRDEAGR